MKKIFINAVIILSLVFTVSVKAQKDYVITVLGDTLKGEIKSTLLGGLKFLNNETKQKVNISVKEYSEYYTWKDSTSYVALTIPLKKGPVFLQRLENGEAQLFVYYITHVTGNGMSTSQTFWYVVKNNQKPLQVKAYSLLGSRKEREDNFYGIIGDYPELLQDFKNEKSYSFDMIRSYIKKYNYYHKFIKKESK